MGAFDDLIPQQAPQGGAFADFIPATASQQSEPREGHGVWDAAVAGYQASIPGLMDRGRLPDVVLNPQHAKWYENAISSLSQTVNEIPEMAAGSFVGGVAGGAAAGPGGALVGAGAGTFAVPQEIRESLIHAYQTGEATDSSSFLQRANVVISGLTNPEIMKSTAKAAAVGALTAGVGSIAARTAGSVLAPMVGDLGVNTVTRAIGAAETAGAVGTMTVAPAVLDGRMPSMSDFANAAILVGGMKLAGHIATGMGQIYAKTGIEPEQVVADAKSDPSIKEDLTSRDATSGEIPKAYQPAAAAENAKSAVREAGVQYPERASAFAMNPTEQMHPQTLGGEKVKGYPNINMFNVDGLENINSVDDLAAMTATAAKHYGPEILKQTGGPQTIQSIIDHSAQALSDLTGQSADMLKARVPGTGAGAVEMYVRGQAALAFMDHAKGLADAWDPVKSSPEETAAMLASAERAAMAQSYYEGAGAEAGRAMRVRQALKAGVNPTIKAMLDDAIAEGNPEKIATAIKTMNDPAQVAAFTRKAFQPKALTTIQKIQSAYKTGLLSGTKIFQVKAIGDAIALGSSVIDKLGGYGIGMLTGSADRVKMDDIGGYISGLQTGAKDTLKVLGANWEKRGEQVSRANPEGYKAIFGEQAKGGEPTQPPAKGSVADTANRVVNIPARIIGTETELAKTYNEQGTAQYLAVRQARSEGFQSGSDDFAARVREIIKSPTVERAAEIEQAGREGTFTAKGGSVWKILHAISQHPVGGFIIPFDTVPANLTKWAVARMPLAANMLDTVQADFKAGGSRRDIAIARQAIGAAVMATAYGAVKSGTLTGGGLFLTPQQREAQKETRQDYSIKMGNTAYSMTRFEPLSRMVQLSADVAEMMDHLGKDDRASLPLMTAMMFGHATLSETYLSGLNNLVRALDDPTRSGPQYFDSLIGSAVPSLLGQIARAHDPVERRIDGWMDAIQSRLPVFREEMLAKLNPLTGEPLPSGSDLTPIDKKSLSTDPVLSEAKRLDIGASKAPKSIELRAAKQRDIGRVDLTPEQQNIFTGASGGFTHRWLSQIVGTDAWNAAPDMTKKMIFEKAISEGHKIGRAEAVTPGQRAAEGQRILEELNKRMTQ